MEETLGKRIVSHRKRLGLTQDQLAERLGVTAQAVSKWENDLSCPDITTLPKLAEIFGTSTDALLGIVKDEPIHEATVVTDTESDENIHIKNGNWEFEYKSSRTGALYLAALVLLIGGLYLASSLLQLEIGLWDIIWPSALLIFGLHGIYPKFSFVALGALIFGGFTLVNQFIPMNIQLDSGVIVAVVILLIGCSLLMDALKKPEKPIISFKNGSTKHTHPMKNEYQIRENSFQFDGAFGHQEQLVTMEFLNAGMINTAFGDYEINLSGVSQVSPNCRLEANVSFGNLTLYVPSKFEVRPSGETAFANMEIDGHPDAVPAGTILLNANISFGAVTVEYI